MRATVLITSGTGPSEVREFVHLLANELRRRWLHAGLTVDSALPEAAGSGSVRLRVEGDALDRLALEEGTHALIARSPRRSRHARKRWYAAVKLLREEPTPSPQRPGRLVVTACRSSGPGGQNVNKRSTAVRAIDPDSGLVVRVDDQRYQRSNRRIAEGRIQKALQARFDVAVAQHRNGVRLQHYRVVRGSPVRTWRVNDAGELEELT